MKEKSIYEIPKTWWLEANAIWIRYDNQILLPTPFCLGWWQTVAERVYGKKDLWLEAAYDLGYVMKVVDPESGNIMYEPWGTQFNEPLVKKSLGIPKNEPLIGTDFCVDSRSYYREWYKLFIKKNKLFRKEKDGEQDSSNLGKSK